MLGNAVSSVLGLAVLSGSFTYIVRALETIHAFEKLMTKDLSDKVFGQAGPQVKRYLKQIEDVAANCEVHHAMLGTNLSAVYGIGK